MSELPERIERRTGIATRYFAAPGQSASDLAMVATERALAAAGIEADAIECIVFATHTPDHAFPGSGCLLAAKLGLIGVPALDIRNQCSGFLYGLSVADHFVRLGTYRTVLVVAAEVMSAGLEFSPRGRVPATLFSDGAGAALLVRAEGAGGVIGSGLHTDGRFARSLMVELPGSCRQGPLTAEDLEIGRHLPVVGGFEVLEEGYRRTLEALREALETCDIATDDVRIFVPSQGVAQLAPLLCRRLGVPMDRMYVELRGVGNATGASVPLALDHLVRAGRIQRGDIVVLFAFGSGFSWGWVVIRW